MKSTILVYCGEDGDAAKALAGSLRDGRSNVVLCSAAAFVRVERTCDRIAFTDDVPIGRRDLIRRSHGLPEPVQAVHKGFGRWWVMRGDQKISGPHSKDEAKRLAA